MSIVAVHGPNTFGSKAISEVGPVVATVNNADATKWTYKLDSTSTRSNQDFSWAFAPTGTPTPQVTKTPTEVTYSAVAAPPTGTAKTATLTVTNTAKTVTNKALTNNVATLTATTHGFIVGQSIVVTGVDATFNGTYIITTVPTGNTLTYDKVAADVTSAASGGTITSDPAQYPTASAYPITVTAFTGGAPAAGLMSAPGGGDEGDEAADVDVGFDPAAHTVDEVEQFVTAHPDQAQSVYDLEIEGKNRVTLITWLEELEA